MKQVELYTDGSWKSKLDSGGWSALLIYWPHWKVITAGETSTSISRMELKAVIHGLEQLTEPCEVTVIADSLYVVKSINDWIQLWEANRWITKTHRPVANVDLMQQLAALMKTHKVRAKWVKAHTKRKDKHSLANRIVDYFAQHSAIEPEN